MASTFTALGDPNPATYRRPSLLLMYTLSKVKGQGHVVIFIIGEHFACELCSMMTETREAKHAQE